MKFVSRIWPVLLIILLCIISRLPQLLSPELLADGDECVIGLMSKHFIEGKELPIFFHGQAYGFSLLECLPISLSFLAFGVNDLGLKVPMLLMFTMAMVFFYLSLKAMSPQHKRFALIVTIVFILLPAWAVWSMKARGGYLTSILFSHMLLWLVFKDQTLSKLQWVIIGICLVIIYQSQPLWLPGLLPILAYRLYPQVSRKNILLLLSSMVPLSVLFFILKLFASHHWHPQVFSFNPMVVAKRLQELPALLFEHFNGFYFLYYICKAPLICNIASVTALVLLAWLMTAGIYKFRNNKNAALFLPALSGILFIIGYCVFLTEHAPRYLLPLSTFLMLALFLLLQQSRTYYLTGIMVALLIITGLPSLYLFKDYTFFPARRQEVKACVRYLSDNNIRYVFSNDGLLQWQIMFYSKEQIICRESDTADRYPEYVRAVNHAYTFDNQHVAVVDNTTDIKSISPDSTVNVISHFYILPHPSKEAIRDMEFKF